MSTIYQLQGIYDNKKLRFSWKLTGKEGQTAYRIIVRAGEAVAWNSGKVLSPVRHGIYCDAKLQPGKNYDWYVTCWLADGQEISAQGNSFFTEIEEWKAQWIEPVRTRKPLRDDIHPTEGLVEKDEPLEKLDEAIYMRKNFVLKQLPKDAKMYATARGIYAMWVNGNLVSDILAPGFTAYAKRLEYQCYDVKEHLKVGENEILVVLADGWYTGKIACAGIGQQYGTENAMLFQLDYKMEDGKQGNILSDREVLHAAGHYLYADLFVGEYYDAGQKPENWKPVQIKEYGYDNLVLQSLAPVQESRVIVPKVVISPKGELILDAGETIVGYVSFELELEKNQVVTLEHSETVDVEGNFWQNIIGQNKHQMNRYKADEKGMHSYKPLLTFHGFRYVRVSGTTDTNPEHYKIHVIVTPKARTGYFKCSDERLNQLQENILRSQEGNMVCIPTDCPQRERTGWTGDIQVYAPTACFEEDVEQFLRHWLKDMALEQLEDGQIQQIVPYTPSHDVMKPAWVTEISTAAWSDAAIIVPWRLYEAYGDKTILEENFSMMKRYMDSVENLAKNRPADKQGEPEEHEQYLWNTGFQFGDWLMPSVLANGGSTFDCIKISAYEVATLMYAYTTSLMKKTCQVLGKEDLVQHYDVLNQNIRRAYAKEYMLPEGRMTRHYQGIYVLALAMDAVPEEVKEQAVQHLVQLIRDNGTRLDTGFVSVPFLLSVLAENGQKELANELLFQEKCPSWLYEVKMGATTMWESWTAYDEQGNPSTFSMNHYAFGCVGDYLFRNIAGIKPLEPGFGKVRIEPDFDCGLDWVDCAFDTIWGKIEVFWKKDEDGNQLKVTLPPNVIAE